jgi:hypothetical protein
VIACLLSLVYPQPELQAEVIQTDSFTICAIRALRGDWGQLEPWQREAYLTGLSRNSTVQGRAWITHYWPAEGRQGQVDSRGNPCTRRTAAANRIPRRHWVWVANPCQIRQVLDCGARGNDRQAERYGADLWIDLWNPGPKGNYLSGYVVIPR